MKKTKKFPTLANIKSFKKPKHLTHTSHKKIPSEKRKFEVVRIMNKFHEEILNEKDKLTSEELKEAKKSVFTLGRIYSLQSDPVAAPALNKLSNRLESIELGQTNLDRGEKLGKGGINTVFKTKKMTKSWS